jgi:leucyl-tRNA synthetase
MPIQAAANRLKREITQGKTNSNQPSAEELKKNPKMNKPALTQFEILKQVGMKDEQIPEFQDPVHWLNFFPPLGRDDLKAFGVHTDWRRSFITTEANPYYDSFIRW